MNSPDGFPREDISIMPNIVVKSVVLKLTYLIDTLRILRAIVKPRNLALVDDQAATVRQPTVAVGARALVSATDEQANLVLTFVATHRVVYIAFRCRCQ